MRRKKGRIPKGKKLRNREANKVRMEGMRLWLKRIRAFESSA